MLKLYPRLALQNLRKNYRITVPYILSGCGIIMMYYMLYALCVGTQSSKFYGVTSAGAMLGLGIYIIAIFGAIFLFYTNSFLMKRRKKELGLYNILGMEKRHIAVVILSETLLTAVICLALGVGLGLVFSKLFFMVLERFIGGVNPVPFVISLQGIRDSALIFGGIFLLTALYNILQVRLSKPIELLHGNETGEKEPKAHWILAVLGLGLLGSGYYMAVTIQDPITAMVMFFVAVILVILGTYLLFIVGITAMLKILKKNKSFYYKTQHFTAVSGMLYRMKQNAAGLASICILFTCLLVTVSTTFCLYTGIDDMVKTQCPRDVNFSVTANLSAAEMQAIRDKADQSCKKHDVQIENLTDRIYWEVSGGRNNGEFCINYAVDANTTCIFEVYTLESYHSFGGTEPSLDADQVLLYDPKNSIPYDSIKLFGKDYSVKRAEFPGGMADTRENLLGYSSACLVVNDPDLFSEDGNLIGKGGDSPEPLSVSPTFSYNFDVAGHGRDKINAVYEEITDWFYDEHIYTLACYDSGDSLSTMARNAVSSRDDLASLFGGVFFLGLFMGAMFLLGTVLIMYYKQVSEGYEDARRFDIMQKVGMSLSEVKKSIHSQVLMVFFLPLLAALVHLCFAFPMLQKILMLMNMVNYQLILVSTGFTVLIFSAAYLLIYLLTARTYYRIVRSAK